MSGKNAAQHTLESTIKSNLMKLVSKYYPMCHAVIIPATYWRLLPYDLYIFADSIFRAIELKVDDNPVMAHQYHALFQVAQNRGYAFVVRWVNANKQLIVENFTNGDSRIFKSLPSERQMIGNSARDVDDRPQSNESALHQAIDYIMAFNVSPLEHEIQDIIKRNYEQILKKTIEGGRKS